MAIIITIMVLELKAPHGAALSDIWPLLPKFVAYLSSFVFVAIYWVNHHHIMQAARTVTSSVLWRNIAMLFMLSLVPFTTAWMSENLFDTYPVMLYIFNLFLCGLTFTAWGAFLVRGHEKDSALVRALRNNTKEKVSILSYAVSFLVAYISPLLGFAGTIVVMMVWLVPDVRVEKATFRADR